MNSKNKLFSYCYDAKLLVFVICYFTSINFYAAFLLYCIFYKLCTPMRDQCFEFGPVHSDRGWLYSFLFCGSSIICIKFSCHKKDLFACNVYREQTFPLPSHSYEAFHVTRGFSSATLFRKCGAKIASSIAKSSM